MAMESKKEIYDLIPEKLDPEKRFFASSEISFNEILSELKSQTINFPVIVKPNIGLKGLGVVQVENVNELEDYQKNNDCDFLIQEKINYQHEVGIFYHRFPDEKKGKNHRNGEERISFRKRKWQKNVERTGDGKSQKCVPDQSHRTENGKRNAENSS